MQEIKREIIEKRIQKTVENLKRNNMDAYYCTTTKDACALVEALLPKGAVIGSGGSMTLKQSGLLELLKSGRYQYLDRGRQGITKEEIEQVYRDTYSADAYFCSSNAITENGELYNVDGNSNRVSAILYGPKHVYFIAGYNKIVRNIDEAVVRVKREAAPANTVRLDMNAGCRETGECVSLKKDHSSLCDGCRMDGRVCCNYVVSAQQRHKGRIRVIIIGETLGY